MNLVGFWGENWGPRAGHVKGKMPGKTGDKDRKQGGVGRRGRSEIWQRKEETISRGWEAF